MTQPLRPRPSRAATGAAIAAAAALAAPVALGGQAGAAAHRPPAHRPPAHAIVHRAEVEVSAAPSLVLTGTLQLHGGTFGFRVESARHGADARGSLLSRSAEVGFVGLLNFVVRGGAVYVRAGAPFWVRQAHRGLAGLTAAERGRATRLLANHWVEMTGTSARAMETSLGRLTHPAAFARTLLSARTLGALHEGQPTRYRGHVALPIASSKGGTLYVDIKGTTRPIALVTRSTSRTTGGTVLFGYPRRIAVVRPAHTRTVAQVVAAAGG